MRKNRQGRVLPKWLVGFFLMNSNNLMLTKTETPYKKACKFLISERNACEFSPCKNGGRCEIVNATFLCRCPFGYTGDRCETG